MVVDDTAIFSVRSQNSESSTVTIGGGADVFPEFGAIVYAQQKSGNEMIEFDIFRCKSIGLPLLMSEKAFSESDLTIESFFDSALNGVFSMRHIITV